jgi:hypothetical protein
MRTAFALNQPVIPANQALPKLPELGCLSSIVFAEETQEHAERWPNKAGSANVGL